VDLSNALLRERKDVRYFRQAKVLVIVEGKNLPLHFRELFNAISDEADQLRGGRCLGGKRAAADGVEADKD
jgi:hypothetical protein